MIVILAFLIIVSALLLGVYILIHSDTAPVDVPPKASDTLLDMLKDPLVTSRAYFTEPATGPMGDFVGYSPMSQDDWLHSLPHEESQDKGSKYDKIGSLV